eukprot:Rhum_TRINITY_DN13025_c0_g1::Rhum_TRINITY_DN13025_c0_g1_i4::g.56349::m.56349
MLLHGCSLLPQDKLQAFQRQLVLSSEIRQQRGRPALIGAQLCDQELQLLAGHLVQRLRARCRHRLLLAPLCLKRLHTRRRPGELLLRRGRQGLRFARPLRQGTRLAHPLLEQLLHLPPHGGHLRRRLVALAPRPFPHVPQHRLRTLQLCLQPLLPVQRPPLLPRRRTRCSGLRSPRVPRLLLGGGGVRVRVCRWLSPGVRGSCLHRRVACRVSPLLHRDAQRVDAGGNLFAQRSIAFGALPSGLLNHPLHTLQLCADVRHNVRTQLFQVRCRPHRLPQPCDLLAQRSVALRLLRRPVPIGLLHVRRLHRCGNGRHLVPQSQALFGALRSRLFDSLTNAPQRFLEIGSQTCICEAGGCTHRRTDVRGDFLTQRS